MFIGIKNSLARLIFSFIAVFLISGTCFGDYEIKNLVIDKANAPQKNAITFQDKSKKQRVIPGKVRNKILAMVNCYFNQVLTEENLKDLGDGKNKFVNWCKNTNVYDLTYVLKMPSGKQLYVTRLKELPPITYAACFMFVYDPSTDFTSGNCPFFSEKNTDESLNPIVCVENSQIGDGDIIVTREGGHNGAWNAKIKNIYKVDKDLTIKRVLTFEEQGNDCDPDKDVYRELESKLSKKITLNVYSSLRGKKSKTVIGKVYLEQKNDFGLFSVRKKISLNSKYETSGLFNAHKDDDVLIKDGYGYYLIPENCGFSR